MIKQLSGSGKTSLHHISPISQDKEQEQQVFQHPLPSPVCLSNWHFSIVRDNPYDNPGWEALGIKTYGLRDKYHSFNILNQF